MSAKQKKTWIGTYPPLSCVKCGARGTAIAVCCDTTLYEDNSHECPYCIKCCPVHSYKWKYIKTKEDYEKRKRELGI